MGEVYRREIGRPETVVGRRTPILVCDEGGRLARRHGPLFLIGDGPQIELTLTFLFDRQKRLSGL